MKITRILPALLCSTLLLGACGPESDRDDDNNTHTSPLTCDDVNRTQDAPVLVSEPGKITLSGTYKVTGRTIYDGDQDITIEPGTVFLMDSTSSLLIGWRSDPAKIAARGTAEKPILFCGTEKAKGHWKNIEFLTGTVPGSVFEHVRIEDAGREDNALLVNADVDLKSVGVYDSGAIGISMKMLGKNSENITVKGSTLHPLDLHGAMAVTNLPDGDYTGNGEDIALFHGGGENIVFNDRGIPYRQVQERVTYGSAGESRQVTYNAGVEYQLCAGCYLQLGWRSDQTTFKSLGTAEKPVIFTSASATPKPGDWNGVQLLSGIMEDSKIEFTEFHWGGKPEGANFSIETEKTISVTNSKFSNSAGYGVILESDKTPFDAAANDFDNNALGDVYIP